MSHFVVVLDLFDSGSELWNILGKEDGGKKDDGRCFRAACDAYSFPQFSFPKSPLEAPSEATILFASLPFWQSRAGYLRDRFREMRPAPAKIVRWGASSIRFLSRLYTTLYGRLPPGRLRLIHTVGLGHMSPRLGRPRAISFYVNSTVEEAAHIVPIARNPHRGSGRASKPNAVTSTVACDTRSPPTAYQHFEDDDSACANRK